MPLSHGFFLTQLEIWLPQGPSQRSGASAMGQQHQEGLPRCNTKHKTPRSPSGFLEQRSLAQPWKFQFVHCNPNTPVPQTGKGLIKGLRPCWLVLWSYSALQDSAGAEYHEAAKLGMEASPRDGPWDRRTTSMATWGLQRGHSELALALKQQMELRQDQVTLKLYPYADNLLSHSAGCSSAQCLLSI